MIKPLWIDIKYIRQPRKRLLHHILNNHLHAVEQMIQKSVDPNPTPEEMSVASNLFWTDWGELNCPPLFAAVRSGSVSMVELVLKHVDPSICVPRSMSMRIGPQSEEQSEDVWSMNAVDYLIEFANGHARKPIPERINPVEAKLQNYLEIYKLLRAHIKPNPISEKWLEQFQYSNKTFLPFKKLEEEELLNEQKRRILDQIEPGQPSNPRRM